MARQPERRKHGVLVGLAVFTLLVGVATHGWAQGRAGRADRVPYPFPKKVKAPPLDSGLGWLNTEEPLELQKLRGKIVLLDFWTYCCINCIHVLPDLEKLEKEFANELVVIGVHSAKFEGEKDMTNIRDAILRYGIEHPVINDGRMRLWRAYDVRSWPSIYLIDADGFVCRRYSGEGNYAAIREDIEKLIAYHRGAGTLDETPLAFALEAAKAEPTPLRYPGKVVADPNGDRLYISDSSHHRLVVVERSTGKLLHVIGDGVAGLRDGSFSEARFNDPQDLIPAGNVLYVADRKNHALRLVDLHRQMVVTLAGNGERGYERFPNGTGKAVQLASPWGLERVGDTLYIASAGTHQIWRMDLQTYRVSNFSGSGREDIIDSAVAANAAFAQPSGLVADENWLYVADSETSSIRRVSLQNGAAETIVGKGLFEFGDRDGPTSRARLQHALGVAHQNGQLYVADTYNNKIKRIDLKSARVETFLGDGRAELSDDPPRFDEPGGIHRFGDTLYVADTNNHAIRVIDIPSKQVTTLVIEGLEPPSSSSAETEAGSGAEPKPGADPAEPAPEGDAVGQGGQGG